MRKLYSRLCLGLLALFCSYLSVAQVSVTATAGTTGPTPYTTLKAAFDAINAGTHQGSITVSISANTTETATAALNASGTGSATYTAVLIRPTATATVSGSIAGPLVDLNGADNVTIDGRIGSTGTTISLTISNTSTSNTGNTSTTRMINSAQNNTLTYLNLQGSGVLSTSATGVVLIDSSLAGGGNTGITISNNDIGAAGANQPSVGIYSVGESATLLNSNITISNNLIHDCFNPAGVSAGIFANLWSNAFTITGNSIYQTAARTSTAATAHIGIYLFDGNSHTVTSNFIGGGAASAGGTATTISGAFSNRFFGILLDVGNTTATNVNGNTITNINVSSTPAASANVFTGIQIDGGTVNVGSTTGNTIGSLTGTGAIVFNVSGTNTNFNDGIVSFSTDPVNIRNNNIGSITANGTATGTVVLRGIEAYSYSSFTADGNTVGGTTAASIQANTANNQMGGIFAYPNSNNATCTLNNNTIRNFTNNATGTNASIIYGVNAQINANSIAVVFNITNNQISNFSAPGTSATVGSLYGITTGIGTTTGSTVNANINNNTISNLNSASTAATYSVRGIQAGTGYTALNINNNTIHTLTAAAPNTAAVTSAVAVQGIASSTSSAGTVSISGNTIYNLESTAAAATYVAGVGVFHGDNTNQATVSKNKIYDLRIPNGTATALVTGIVLRGSANAGTFNVSNNMISLSPASVQVVGIHNNTVATALNAYYNSVYLGGTATGTNSSSAFFRNMPTTATAATAVDIKNNIFYNARTGGTGGHAAVSNFYTTPATGWTSNFNNLYSVNAATIALWGTTPNDLATYKTNAGDANSKSVTVTFTNTATGDLHLSGASATDANLNGTPITGITTDYDNETRSTTTPKMGADEPSVACVAPAITTQPTAQTVCAGSALNLSVTATGTNLTYQWRKGTTNIAGATNATYTIASTVAGDAGSYDVVVSNSCGSVTSNAVAVTINAAPSITAQPAAQAVCNGANATFTVTATGTGLTYQWRLNGTNVTTGTGGTTNSYTVAASAATTGNYTVVVSNGTCSVTSSAAALTINAAPAITTQPASRNACFTTSTTFTVAATGAGLTYQWRKNGANVTTGTGGTTNSYTLTNIAAADAGNYDVVITGTCGNVTSNQATLTVTACTSVPNVDAQITSIVMTPNVVRDVANVRVNATKATKISWNIVDAQGKIVMTLSSQVAPGKNDIALYVGQLSNGTYQLKGATSKGATEVIRFVKM